MKKLYIILASALLFLAAGKVAKAQDTLLYEGFQAATLPFDTLDFPPGNPTDALWYNYDMDGLTFGSPTYRPKQWFQTGTFSTFDSLLADGSDNIVMSSNSWFATAAAAYNLLITPSVVLGPHDTLFWRSAPRQTPRYCDGYQVLLSNSTNDPTSFTHVLFTAAEMTGTPASNDVNFATHTFSAGFVHGQDGTYIDPTPSTGVTAAYKGRLRPFSAPLNAYAGQTVFIAFNHNSFDDNLIEIDDVMIRSLTAASTVGIQQNSSEPLATFKVFPNPAKETAQINFTIAAETAVVMSVYDLAGKLVYSENKGTMMAGTHFATVNTSVLAKGFYTVMLQTDGGRSTAKLIVE
jgi:hypothetical protein